ncbi:MAG TPA: hypothetical protein PLG43_14625, partial [Spirochaetia bacterium]|nr:hypothetical protein [Spirochaetia bacterium]
VDRKKPDLPVLSGFTPDGIYNTPVRLTATVPDGVKFFIAYSTDSSESTALPDPFSSAAYLFQSSFTLDVADGEEKSFTIRTGAYDPAGNTAILEKPVKITIDKKSPDPPRFSGIPARGLTNEAVLVSFTQTDGDVYYTLCKGSEAHEIPTKSSIRYEKPFLIEGEAGREIFYNIQAISFDRAGNISPECSSAQFIIDREPPPKPEKPSITPLKLKNSLIVSWPAVLPALQDVSIYYAAGSEKEFRKYDLPFEIKPDKKESISLSYYAEDDAGNRSDVESIEFDLVSLSENFVSGIQQGMVTNKPVRFTPLAATGIVRYEVSTSGREAAPVSQFSSQLGDGVEFDAAFGETISFSVRFKLFESVTDPVGGSEKSVSFTIDKTPPPPPELSGIADGAFYQDDRILSFTAPEGDIYYLVTYTDTGNPLFEKDFSRYT